MWENAFYVGGDDDGVIAANGLGELPTDGREELASLTIGAAVCWELMRTQTVGRLRGRIDLALTGSGWWSVSENWPPRAVMRRLEAANHRRAVHAAEAFALYVGAPVIHAAHAGRLECPMPWLRLPYRGRFEGGALICDRDGRVLARRHRNDGEGLAVAEVEPGRREPLLNPPDRFWLHRRGALAALAWSYQGLHGRPWYKRHVRGRPARSASRVPVGS